MPDYRAEIKPQSPFSTPLHSDTLFGHFCWAYAYLKGEKELEALLSMLKEGEATLVFSNGFPSGWIPMPVLPPLPAREEDELREEWNRSSLRLGEAFEDFLKEEAKRAMISAEDLTALRQDFSLKSLIKRLVENGRRKPPKQVAESVPHASLNRLTQTAERFFMTEQFFLSGADGGTRGSTVEADTWEFFIRTDLIEEDELQECIRSIGDCGFGKDKSTGKGRFALNSITETDLFSFDNPNAYIVLSQYVPAAADSTRGWYRLLTKYGKLGGHFASAGSPFKKPIIEIEAGAVFLVKDTLPKRIGRLLSDVHADSRICQSGQAIPLPFKLDMTAIGEA